MEPGPVLVAGLERSGTSLTFALLASHPNIAMVRRTNLWTYFYDQFGDLADDANANRCIDRMMQYKRLVVLQPDEDRLRREFLAGDRSYARLFGLFFEQQAERAGKPRWGDKSLHTERFAEEIFRAWPTARIVHMMRDPRDRYASVQARWKSRLGGVGAGTAEWLMSAKLANRNLATWPDRYRVVRYEDLAAEPEDTVRSLCEFLNEPFEPTMLAMDGAAAFRDQGANSSYGSRPPGLISTDSIGRFRTVLDPEQIAFIEQMTGSTMEGFGYEPEHVRLRGKRAAHYASVRLPVETAKLLAWRARTELHNRRGRALPSYRLVQGTTGA